MRAFVDTIRSDGERRASQAEIAAIVVAEIAIIVAAIAVIL